MWNSLSLLVPWATTIFANKKGARKYLVFKGFVFFISKKNFAIHSLFCMGSHDSFKDLDLITIGSFSLLFHMYILVLLIHSRFVN